MNRNNNNQERNARPRNDRPRIQVQCPICLVNQASFQYHHDSQMVHLTCHDCAFNSHLHNCTQARHGREIRRHPEGLILSPNLSNMHMECPLCRDRSTIFPGRAFYNRERINLVAREIQTSGRYFAQRGIHYFRPEQVPAPEAAPVAAREELPQVQNAVAQIPPVEPPPLQAELQQIAEEVPLPPINLIRQAMYESSDDESEVSSMSSISEDSEDDLLGAERRREERERERAAQIARENVARPIPQEQPVAREEQDVPVAQPAVPAAPQALVIPADDEDSTAEDPRVQEARPDPRGEQFIPNVYAKLYYRLSYRSWLWLMALWLWACFTFPFRFIYNFIARVFCIPLGIDGTIAEPDEHIDPIADVRRIPPKPLTHKSINMQTLNRFDAVQQMYTHFETVPICQELFDEMYARRVGNIDSEDLIRYIKSEFKLRYPNIDIITLHYTSSVVAQTIAIERAVEKLLSSANSASVSSRLW